MFAFIKRVLVVIMAFFYFNPSDLNSLECVSMNNQECKTRTKIINISNKVNKIISIKVNKCSGSCNNINDLYAKLCFLNVAKNINVKVFNLMSFSNQTRH